MIENDRMIRDIIWCNIYKTLNYVVFEGIT